MNLTVFGGTFNPIHIAHLILAEWVKSDLNLDKILFIPSYIPPHRENEIADSKHRLQMVKLAISGNPAFEFSDIEFQRKGKSYAIDTIRQLYTDYPDVAGKINFLIGTDAFLHIDSWHKSEELVELVNFIIFARQGTPDAEKIIENKKLKNINYTILETPVIEISSSSIRERIKNGKSIKYLVNDGVGEYIQKNKLYTDSSLRG